jgi:hypothetical protein
LPVSFEFGPPVEATALGYVRLSFAVDGWASDADGLKVPGSPSYKTNLVDGFPFGAVVGKIGVSGQRFIVGRHLDKTGLGEGRLYLAVNDNPHWQNNIGSFRVKLRVSDAYDVGDPVVSAARCTPKTVFDNLSYRDSPQPRFIHARQHDVRFYNCASL